MVRTMEEKLNEELSNIMEEERLPDMTLVTIKRLLCDGDINPNVNKPITGITEYVEAHHDEICVVFKPLCVDHVNDIIDFILHRMEAVDYIGTVYDIDETTITIRVDTKYRNNDRINDFINNRQNYKAEFLFSVDDEYKLNRVIGIFITA